MTTLANEIDYLCNLFLPKTFCLDLAVDDAVRRGARIRVPSKFPLERQHPSISYGAN